MECCRKYFTLCVSRGLLSIYLEIHYIIYGQVYDAVFFKYVALVGENVGFGDIVTLVGDEFVYGTVNLVVPA